MNELTAKVSEPTALQNPTSTELALLKRLEDCAVVMRGMADMMRTTNERMGALEREVRMLTKVTPAQATAIHTAIRERAAALCLSYRAIGCEKQAAAAIRKAIRQTMGAQAVRERRRAVPVAEIVMKQVAMWDDYKTMKRIKNKEVVASGKLPGAAVLDRKTALRYRNAKRHRRGVSVPAGGARNRRSAKQKMIRIAHGMQANRHRGDMRKRRDNMKQHNEKNLLPPNIIADCPADE